MHGAKIIAVSDNPELLRASVRALEKAGHHVCTAGNMKELMEHLSGGSCDLVHICFSLAVEEKRRIANMVRQSYPYCRILEVYDEAPVLEDADGRVHKDAEEEELLQSVAAALAA